MNSNRSQNRRGVITIRRWKAKHSVLVFFIEKLFPILYYTLITACIDIQALQHYEIVGSKESLIFLYGVCCLIFQISLLLGYMFWTDPTNKAIKLYLPIALWILPLLNCWVLILTPHFWICLILLILSYYLVKSGVGRYRKRVSSRDLIFFRDYLQYQLPPYTTWHYGYLEYIYKDITKDFPHLPKRFKKYIIGYNTGMERFSEEGLYFNSTKVD